jgi:hypothetical protein
MSGRNRCRNAGRLQERTDDGVKTAWRIAAALALAAGVAWGQATPAPVPGRYNVMAAGYYAREVRDQEWRLKLVGEIPSLSGAYVVVHDAKGRLVYGGVIPHGKYPPEKPYQVAVKPDGIAGDYKIIIVGYQDDMLGLMTPFTDLPLEVYGGGTMSMGHDANAKPFFKVPEGVTKMKLGAYVGNLQVYDAAGKLVADTRKEGVKEKYDNTIEFPVIPGQVYRFERQTMYFRSYTPGAFFIGVRPEKCFVPDPELDKVKWWELVKERREQRTEN